MGSYLLKLPLYISISSLLLSYSVYLFQLFTIGDAYMGWLLISVLMSSALLFSTTHLESRLHRRSVRNALLMIHIPLAGYATFLAFSMQDPYSTILSSAGLLLLAGIVAGIYRTTLVANVAANVKVLHVLNITMGIALTAGTWYFLFLFYLYSEDGDGAVWKLLVPFVLYGIAYIIQMKALGAQRKRIAYSVAVMQLLMPVVLMRIWTALATWEGML